MVKFSLELVPKFFRPFPILWLYTFLSIEKLNRLFSSKGNHSYFNIEAFPWS